MKSKLCLGFFWLASAVLLTAAPANVIIRVPAGTPLPAQLAPLLAQWRQSGRSPTCSS